MLSQMLSLLSWASKKTKSSKPPVPYFCYSDKYKAELATEMEEVRELIVPLLKRAGSSGSVDDGYNPAGIEGDD